MEELLALLSKLGASGVIPETLRAIVLTSALVLWGSWKKVWTWSRDIDALRDHYDVHVAELIDRYEKLLVKEQEEKEWWRSIAMRATGIAEVQGAATAVLVKKTDEKAAS